MKVKGAELKIERGEQEWSMDGHRFGPISSTVTFTAHLALAPGEQDELERIAGSGAGGLFGVLLSVMESMLPEPAREVTHVEGPGGA